MKKIMFLFAAAVVLAAVGCSKDDAALNDVQYVSELKINFDGDTRVSASHSAAGLKFAWEDGDVVYVYEDGNTSATAKMLSSRNTRMWSYKASVSILSNLAI